MCFTYVLIHSFVCCLCMYVFYMFVCRSCEPRWPDMLKTKPGFEQLRHARRCHTASWNPSNLCLSKRWILENAHWWIYWTLSAKFGSAAGIQWGTPRSSIAICRRTAIQTLLRNMELRTFEVNSFNLYRTFRFELRALFSSNQNAKHLREQLHIIFSLSPPEEKTNLMFSPPMPCITASPQEEALSAQFTAFLEPEVTAQPKDLR